MSLPSRALVALPCPDARSVHTPVTGLSLPMAAREDLEASEESLGFRSRSLSHCDCSDVVARASPRNLPPLTLHPQSSLAKWRSVAKWVDARCVRNRPDASHLDGEGKGSSKD